MRRILYLLLLFPGIVNGQTILSQEVYRVDSLYFPPFSFNCDKSFDEITNDHYSEVLISLHKSKIYNNENIRECFRLLYQGQYLSVVEVYKSNNCFIIVADSIDNFYVNYRRIDTLDQSINGKYNDLLSLIDPLWRLPNHENCIENVEHENVITVFEDDRDEWVLELKMGENYHSINRIVANKQMSECIAFIMALGNLHGYRIYKSDEEFEEY